nr:MAG TPA: hypothetical protein [Caudoviricetes sp.]DAZ26608.1 MAG TPA: hypothetical protein [Caudoviricetes sp.]
MGNGIRFSGWRGRLIANHSSLCDGKKITVLAAKM